MKGQQKSLTRQVFVAYAYNLYDQRDYRRVFASLERDFGIEFIFADEKITNMHILQKIISHIRGSDFSLFDISSWNPNVTLELGVALALSDDWYILFNPEKIAMAEVPSDIRGIDRIQYASFSDLEDRLSVLLDQWYPQRARATTTDYFVNAQRSVLGLIRTQPGLKVTEISDVLRMNLRVAQVVVRNLVVAGSIRTEGKARGVKYFPS
jgi:hypothetical protein